MVVPWVRDAQISYSLSDSAKNHQLLSHSPLPPHYLGDIFNEVSTHNCLGRVWTAACRQMSIFSGTKSDSFTYGCSWKAETLPHKGLGNDVGELNFIPAPTIWEATTEQSKHPSARNSLGELLLRQSCCCSSMNLGLKSLLSDSFSFCSLLYCMLWVGVLPCH